MADLKFRNDSAFVTHILHIFPPLVRVEVKEQLLSQLLIQNQSAGGSLPVKIIEGAIILAVIAVGGGTVQTLQSGEDEFKVDVVLQQFVVFTEAFHEAVGLAVVSLIS